MSLLLVGRADVGRHAGVKADDQLHWVLRGAFVDSSQHPLPGNTEFIPQFRHRSNELKHAKRIALRGRGLLGRRARHKLRRCRCEKDEAPEDQGIDIGGLSAIRVCEFALLGL